MIEILHSMITYHEPKTVTFINPGKHYLVVNQLIKMVDVYGIYDYDGFSYQYPFDFKTVDFCFNCPKIPKSSLLVVLEGHRTFPPLLNPQYSNNDCLFCIENQRVTTHDFIESSFNESRYQKTNFNDYGMKVYELYGR